MRRKGCGLDHLRRPKDDGPLDGVPELANISRPSISEQRVFRCLGKFRRMAPGGFGEEQEKSPRESENIFRPFPQGRELQINHVEPIKQILPKETLPYMILQIAIGGGHGPNIGVPGFVLADAFEFLVFEEAQQLCLQETE